MEHKQQTNTAGFHRLSTDKPSQHSPRLNHCIPAAKQLHSLLCDEGINNRVATPNQNEAQLSPLSNSEMVLAVTWPKQPSCNPNKVLQPPKHTMNNNTNHRPQRIINSTPSIAMGTQHRPQWIINSSPQIPSGPRRSWTPQPKLLGKRMWTIMQMNSQFPDLCVRNNNAEPHLQPVRKGFSHSIHQFAEENDVGKTQEILVREK